MKTTMKTLRAVRGWLPPTLIVLGSLWLFQSALARTGGHGVFIAGADYDAGTVKAGAIVRHDLRLVNLSAAVEVDPQPGCGCTVVSAPDRALAPLHAETVGSQVDTEGMKPGHYRKAIMVYLCADGHTWQQPTWITFRLR